MDFALHHRLLEPESPIEVYPWRVIESNDHSYLVDHIAEDIDRRSAWRIVARGKRPVLWTGGNGRAVPMLAPRWLSWDLPDERTTWCEAYDWLGAWTACERADWMFGALRDIAPGLMRWQTIRAVEAIARPHLVHQIPGSTLALDVLDAVARRARTEAPGRDEALSALVSACFQFVSATEPTLDAGRTIVLIAGHIASHVENNSGNGRWLALAAREVLTSFPPSDNPSRDADIVRRFVTPDAVYRTLSDLALDGVSR